MEYADKSDRALAWLFLPASANLRHTRITLLIYHTFLSQHLPISNGETETVRNIQGLIRRNGVLGLNHKRRSRSLRAAPPWQPDLIRVKTRWDGNRAFPHWGLVGFGTFRPNHPGWFPTTLSRLVSKYNPN